MYFSSSVIWSIQQPDQKFCCFRCHGLGYPTYVNWAFQSVKHLVQTTWSNSLPKQTNHELQIQNGFFSESCSMFSSVFLGLNWAHNMLGFEDLIQKVNETIYLSHFYTSDPFTQIHKALFIYHMQFSQKVLVSTMCWCNSIFWKFQSFLFVSIFIHYNVKNCPVCSVGMFHTISFTWKFFKNVL